MHLYEVAIKIRILLLHPNNHFTHVTLVCKFVSDFPAEFLILHLRGIIQQHERIWFI